MKVLVMAPDQLLTRAGGLRTQVERTVSELRALGHEVELFNPWREYDFADFDLCHIFSMNCPTVFKYALVQGRIPVVFSSVMWREGRRSLIRTLVEIFRRSPYWITNDVIACRTMSETADRIMPNTHQEKAWLGEAIGVDTTKCDVVPNGADDHFADRSLAELESASSITFEDEFVFCCSVVSGRKNLARLAKVCVKNGLPLVVAGPVVDQKIERELKEIGKGTDLIRLVGKLDNDSAELGYLYKKAKVFCLPSFYETPGISALESALCGGNVVVTKVGGAEDYFVDMARYVNPYSPSDIEEKVLDAWQNGPLADPEMLRERIVTAFSWKAVAEQTADVYRSLLKNGQD